MGHLEKSGLKGLNDEEGSERRIEVSNNNKTVNGKSIMGIMTLAASKGSIINIKIDGFDADRAEKGLRDLINNRFGEPE